MFFFVFLVLNEATTNDSSCNTSALAGSESSHQGDFLLKNIYYPIKTHKQENVDIPARSN